MNKKELFAFLTSKIESFSWPPTKSVCVTSGQAVSACGLSVPMADCNHEEADTRIMVHIRHALEHGAETVLVRTVDTDVVVILVGLFFDLVTIQPSCDFWIAFGMGKNYRLYHINSICESLGEPRSRALPVFHAFSGCDTTSAFNGKGKKSQASLAGLWWRYGNIPLPGQASIYAAGRWLRQLSEAGEVDSHTVWQMESFVLSQRNTQATLLSWELVNGETPPYPRCSSPTCQVCSIPSRYLDKQYKHSTGTSISTWLWLDEGTRDIHVGTSLDDYSWGVKDMQETH